MSAFSSKVICCVFSAMMSCEWLRMSTSTSRLEEAHSRNRTLHTVEKQNAGGIQVWLPKVRVSNTTSGALSGPSKHGGVLR